MKQVYYQVLINKYQCYALYPNNIKEIITQYSVTNMINLKILQKLFHIPKGKVFLKITEIYAT